MEISFSQINGHEVIDFESTLDKYFDSTNKIIKKIKSLKGTISIEKVGSILVCKVSLKCILTVASSYTGNLFNTNVTINDDLYFTNKQDQEREDLIYVKDSIDLDYYVYSLVLTSLPIDIHKKGEVLPSGNGYRVIKEEDLIIERNAHDNDDNPFRKLEGIDFNK